MSVYASLFDKFNTSNEDLDDKQKASLFRKGLLNFGINSLATKGQGFGGSFAAGLQGGLLSMNQGAQDIGNQKYKDEIMARTRAGMERNTAIEQLGKQFMGADGAFDEAGYGNALAQFDPQAALEYKSKLTPKQAKPELKQIGDGEGGTIDVWVNPDTQEVRDMQGNVISGGGQQAPQLGDGPLAQPQGITSGALAPQQPSSGPGALDLSGGPESWYASIGDAVKPFGGTIGSTTGGKHNVGSLHGSGNAVDIPLGGWRGISPENQQAMIDRLGQQPGIKVRDERQRPAGQAVWGGPHLHVERDAQAQAPSPMASRIGRRPAKVEESKDKERYRTLTAPEVKALGLPEGTVAQSGPTGQIQIVNKPKDLPGAQTQVIDNGDGTQTIIPAGKTTEDQNKSAGYALRMEQALESIAGSAATNPGANRPGFGIAMLDKLPDAVGNYMKPQERQNIEAAQLDALDAALTLNTGAAYTKEQLFGLRKSYFPQPGDDDKTVEQKAGRLQNLIKTARLRARGAYPGGSAPAAPESAPKRLKFNPATGKLE